MKERLDWGMEILLPGQEVELQTELWVIQLMLPKFNFIKHDTHYSGLELEVKLYTQ